MKSNFICSISIIFFFGFAECTDPAGEFNRDPSVVHYSKHARCRMTCRHIDESEVKEILEKEQINFSKSELNADACHKRYALEGTSHEEQKLRIIVAECNDDLTV